MFLQTLVPWINDVGVDVLSDPRAAGDSRPYESVHVNLDTAENCCGFIILTYLIFLKYSYSVFHNRPAAMWL